MPAHCWFTLPPPIPYPSPNTHYTNHPIHHRNPRTESTRTGVALAAVDDAAPADAVLAPAPGAGGCVGAGTEGACTTRGG